MQRDLEAGNSPQRVGQRRMLRRRHARVRNDDRIAGQLRPVLPQKGCEAAAAHLLFAFDDEGDIARQLGPGLEISLHRFEVRQVLAFVVARAAPVERAVGDARLERRRLPQVQRLRRLHIVMPVNHEVRTARALRLRARRLGDHNRVALAWGRAAPPGRSACNASRPTPRRRANPGGAAVGRKRSETAHTRRVRCTNRASFCFK